MQPLSDLQVVLITSASVTAAAHRGLLSEFEVETLGEVCRRFLSEARQAVITDAEWQVVKSIVAANPGADFLLQPGRASAR